MASVLPVRLHQATRHSLSEGIAMSQDERKREAAFAASQLVTDGMIVGLGTGSTAKHLVSILGERVRSGLNIIAIPTSEATRLQAEAEGITIVGFAERQHLDLTIDGADEIAGKGLDLIKGGGGALLREKIVAAASDKMVVICDSTKMAPHLGGGFPLPVRDRAVRLGSHLQQAPRSFTQGDAAAEARRHDLRD